MRPIHRTRANLLEPHAPPLPPAWIAEEWLLTDSRGGFAMGTPSGLVTRRYHGLRIASLAPPVRRIATLVAIDEEVITPTNAVHLTPFHFASQQRPPFPETLDAFTHEGSRVQWRYAVPLDDNTLTITKTLELPKDPEDPALARITYSASRSNSESPEIRLRPLLRLADMHELIREGTHEIHATPTPSGCAIHAHAASLHLHAPYATFEHEPCWYNNCFLAQEHDRGQDDTTDLYAPGTFVWNPPPAGSDLTITLSLTPETPIFDAPAAIDDTEPLDHAASQFIVRRAPNDENEPTSSVIAGYPWFTDWGRDTMIALPGLMLEADKLEEAHQALIAFARARRDGLIPNRFADQTGDAEHNTADASLWYLHAATELARRSPSDFPGSEIAEACHDIIDHHLDGTIHDIRVDPADGLLTAGNEHTQLTWMDARRDGVVFTPRAGKCVELNALWIHGLRRIADRTPDAPRQRELNDAADLASDSFNSRFKSPRGGLHDRIDKEDQPVAEIRPNQIFAASLERGPLDRDARRSVVDVCREHLLTPVGLRTLSRDDPDYRPRYEGTLFERDAAYHNGTVWPWLTGPYVEALLRAHDWSDQARTEARSAIQPLIHFAASGPCYGQIPEVFDAEDTREAPRRWSGCPAQAWSVAELRRVSRLIDTPPR